MNKTILATAVLMAFTAVGQANAANVYPWNSSTVPTITNNSLTYAGDTLKKDVWGLGVTSGASGQLDNLSLSIKAKQANGSKNAAQIDAILVDGGTITLGGSSLNASVDTDFIGGGNSHISGLYIQNTQGNANVTLSAETVTLKAISRAEKGKSVYGIAVGGDLNISSKSVDIYVESATNRGANSYSEIHGIDVWQKTLTTSKDTAIKITGKSTSTETTTNGSNGASSIYGVKFEGGQGNINGTIDVNVEAVGGNAIGVGVTNYFYNTSYGEKFNDSGANINNVKVVATSKTGKAAGIDTSYTKGQENTVILKVTGNTDLSASTENGQAYGVNVTGDTTVLLSGNLFAEATTTGSGKAYSVNTDKGTLDLAGKNITLKGDVVAKNAGKLTFGNDTGSNVAIDGNVTVDAQSGLTLNNAAVDLAIGNTMKVDGTLTSTNGQLFVNEAKENLVTIANLADDSTFTMGATGSLNDKLGGDIEAFNKTFTITNGAEQADILMKEGLVAGEKTAQLNKDGTIDKSTITEKTNSVMDSTLQMASYMPMAMTRILTNDVRKRMGDLRAAEGNSGAWARYDGGKFSGERGFDTDFHTIQVGVDTVPTPDSARFGIAFSYTDGESDYVRTKSDMSAFSLAGYATWMAENGLFVDGVLRMAKVTNDVTVDGNLKGTMDNVVLSASAETGLRFDLNEMFYVEPQAEVMYTYVDGDKFDIGAAQYEINAADSFTGRLGFASGIKCPNNKGDLYYVRASVVHEFLGDSRVTGFAQGSSGILELDGKDTWVEYGFGGNFNLTKNTYLWADVERTSGSTLDTDYRATIGVRHAF